MKFITSGTVSGFNSQFVILQYYTTILLHYVYGNRVMLEARIGLLVPIVCS